MVQQRDVLKSIAHTVWALKLLIIHSVYIKMQSFTMQLLDIINEETTSVMYSKCKALIQAQLQCITTLHFCSRPHRVRLRAVVARACVLISRHSSGLSGHWCWLRLSSQVSLLPHGRPIHYSQSWEKSGRKIRNHRPTELGSIDCTFLFRSTRWPVKAWLVLWTASRDIW